MNISNICLIQPIVEVGKSLRTQKSPTGLQSISAFLKMQGYNTKMFHEEFSTNLLQDIKLSKPDLIGISAFSCNFPAAYSLAEALKQMMPKIPIVLGGWHASGAAVAYLRNLEKGKINSLEEILNNNSPFDFIIHGEGEYAITNLINTLNQFIGKNLEENLKSISGIGFIDHSGSIELNWGERILDLDSLPDPDWENLDINKYRDKRNPNMIDLSIHAQRGCRFDCTFCQSPDLYCCNTKQSNQEKISKVQRYSPERIVRYIKHLKENFNPTDITFTDEDFMSNPKWVKQICELIIDNGLHKNIVYGSFGSLNDIMRFEKLGVLKLMKAAGWQNYFVGIESLDPNTLEAYERPLSKDNIKNIDNYIEYVQKAVDISRKNGLLLFGDFIIGYMEESLSDLEKSFNRLKKLKNILYMYFPIFTPLPGTKLWETAIERDYLKLDENGEVNWKEFDCSHQVTNLEYDLVEVRDNFEIEYYSSENYVSDMFDHVNEMPEFLNAWYLPLYNKLKKDHETNSFDTIIEKLQKLSEETSVK
jgi:anaerobic magnesium-protoporphyrin IX monomethyl ester cyclase